MKAVKKDPPRKPIYVRDPKDKRLKAYNDSLSLYNKTVDIENPKNYENGKPSWWTFKGSTEQNIEFMKKNNIDANYTGRFPGKIQPESTGDFGEGMVYPKYKKPVQPVLIAKEVTKANVAPKERSMPTSSIKVNRAVNFPKTVTGVKYDTQKGDVIVGISGKDVTMPRKEFDSWVNKPENRKMFDDYRKSKAKK
jgi:hypothetical protein